MRILSRYILREYLVPLSYCLGGFISIYVLFELFGSFTRLSRAHIPFWTAVRYFCAYLSPYFEYLAPAALMLAALYTMWSFCRHSEIIAMRANGIGFASIAAPILGVAIAMAAFVWWSNDVYVPKHAQWARAMKTEQFDLEKVEAANNIVYRNARDFHTWTISKLLDDDAEHLQDVRVTVERPGGGRRLMNITSPRVDRLDGEWWFHRPEVQYYDENGSEIASPNPQLDALEYRTFPALNEKPSDFIMQNRDWAFNSIRDRLRFMRTHPDLSDQVRRKYRYDIWAKILAPFACVIITLFAIPAGIASGRQSVFRGILGALGMFFTFYGMVIGCMVLVDLGWLPPVLAAVLPYVIFLALGIRAFHKNR